MSRRYKEGDVDTLEAEAYRAGVNSCASHWEEERGKYEAKIAELEEEIERLKSRVVCPRCDGVGAVYIRRNARGEVDYIDGVLTEETDCCSYCEGDGFIYEKD